MVGYRAQGMGQLHTAASVLIQLSNSAVITRSMGKQDIQTLLREDFRVQDLGFWFRV